LCSNRECVWSSRECVWSTWVQDSANGATARERTRAPCMQSRHERPRRVQGEDKVYECTFVQTDVVEGCKYIATKCRLGPGGVAEVLALPDLSPFETDKLEIVKEELNKNIAKGEEFAAARKK
jgi:hypothetical protein